MNAIRLIHCAAMMFAGILCANLSGSEPRKMEYRAMKPASELISIQEPGKVNKATLLNASTQPLAIVISLSKQRAYLLVGGKVAIDSPISSGRRNGWTPKGSFSVLEKDPNHHSSLYGSFVNGSGQVIRSGVSSKHDAAPSGTRFSGAPMKFFLRLTPQGVGMHAGILPGYPASHGCIRLPVEMAQIIYSNVGLNTPVTVGD
jgi:lipoprotein-anchoring transpeptidase ErfK/SrfK